MKLTKSQRQFIINCDIEKLVSLLQEDYKFSLVDAFNVVYNSKLYKKLVNTDNGFYIQSPLYQYGYLKEEMAQ